MSDRFFGAQAEDQEQHSTGCEDNRDEQNEESEANGVPDDLWGNSDCTFDDRLIITMTPSDPRKGGCCDCDRQAMGNAAKDNTESDCEGGTSSGERTVSR